MIGRRNFPSVILGIIWIYQGLVPKLLYRETGELEMLRLSRAVTGFEEKILFAIGLAEILFGIALLFIQKKIFHYLNIAALALLAIGALAIKAEIYTYPFSPLPLSLAMIALSVTVLQNMEEKNGKS